jgi:hypothetical protein
MHSWEELSPDEYFINRNRISPILQYAEDELNLTKLEIQSLLIDSDKTEYSKLMETETELTHILSNFDLKVANLRKELVEDMYKAKLAAARSLLLNVMGPLSESSVPRAA